MSHDGLGSPSHTSAAFAGRSRPILVVCDDATTLSRYHSLLCRAGFCVTTASSGEDCLCLLKACPTLALALIDLRIADMAALDILSELLSRGIDVPVVVVSLQRSSACAFAAQRLHAIGTIDTSCPCDESLTTVSPHIGTAIHALVSRTVSQSDCSGYATRRWSMIVVAVSRCGVDIPTLTSWGSALGKSVATIKRWCQLCDVNAGESLDFGRALRIVRHYAGQHCRWYDVLDIAEPSTMRRYLKRAGFAGGSAVPDLGSFLLSQQFISQERLIESVRETFEGACQTAGPVRSRADI